MQDTEHFERRKSFICANEKFYAFEFYFFVKIVDKYM